MEFTIVSGLSGAGKSKVATLLEDMGFYCVDNMPVQLIPKFAEMCLSSQGKYDRVALVTDVRAGQDFGGLFESLALLKAMNCEYKIIFLEAKTEVIVSRYKETRRRHPLWVEGETIEQTIAKEWNTLEPVRMGADYVINTTSLSTNQLRDMLSELFSGAARARSMVVMISSFGFKYGLPTDSDLVFDVRFLPNPYHIEELRHLTGHDDRVYNFVLDWPQTKEFVGILTHMMEFLLPHYVEEGKTSLVVSIGCTGGRHRSVTIARVLHEVVEKLGYHSVLSHRDVARG